MEHVQRLHEACAEGNVAVVVSLLDGDVGVDTTDEEDTTALQVAAANGQEQIVRVLLERGATVDKPNTAGWTPLLHAVRHGHSTVAALLLQNGASVSARTCFGASVPTLAARSGNLPTCRLLEGSGVSFGKDESSHFVASGSVWEVTPLIIAAHRGHDTIVRHLLSAGNVHYKMPSLGVTALMGAAIGGHVSTTRLLIERGGADANVRDINDRCALDIAVLGGKRQLQEYLDSKTTRRHSLSFDQSEPDIIDAVKQGNIGLVRAILEQDSSQCNANTAQDGATPIMFAAMLGYLDIVKVLVSHGCDINWQDTISGWTALMQATFHGKKAVAKYLISIGADVTIVSKTGCTAFDMATLIEDVDAELYRLLVAAHTAQSSQLEQATKKTKKQQLDLVVQSNESNGVRTSGDGHQKSGIKAWWSRISNRFHNLKPERMSSFKLKEMASEDLQDATLKSQDSAMFAKTLPMKLSEKLTNTDSKELRNGVNSHFDIAAAKSTGVMFSLGTASVLPQGGGRVVKPVVPPFFPPPSFQADRNMKMPPIGLRKPIASLGNSQSLMLSHSINTNAKILQSQHSTLNLVNRVANPPPRVQFANRTTAVKIQLPLLDISPSASCNAAMLESSGGTASLSSGRKSKVLSSASSSTLTAGSDNNGKVPYSGSNQLVRNQRAAKIDKSFDASKSRRRRPEYQGQPATGISSSGHSSKDSASTLTPVQSPKLFPSSGLSGPLPVSATTANSTDDLESILQKLSLECYQPIFEEQEVDMEAFLTLTNADLLELGISSSESRQQILTAISELNMGKDKERQRYQQVMATYADSIRSQRTGGDVPTIGAEGYSASVPAANNWTEIRSVVN